MSCAPFCFVYFGSCSEDTGFKSQYNGQLSWLTFFIVFLSLSMQFCNSKSTSNLWDLQFSLRCHVQVIHTERSHNIQLQTKDGGTDYLPTTCQFQGTSCGVQPWVIRLFHARWQAATTLIFCGSATAIRYLLNVEHNTAQACVSSEEIREKMWTQHAGCVHIIIAKYLGFVLHRSPCIIGETQECFGKTCYLQPQNRGVNKDAIGSPNVYGTIYQNTWRNIPEDRNCKPFDYCDK